MTPTSTRACAPRAAQALPVGEASQRMSKSAASSHAPSGTSVMTGWMGCPNQVPLSRLLKVRGGLWFAPVSTLMAFCKGSLRRSASGAFAGVSAAASVVVTLGSLRSDIHAPPGQVRPPRVIGPPKDWGGRTILPPRTLIESYAAGQRWPRRAPASRWCLAGILPGCQHYRSCLYRTLSTKLVNNSAGLYEGTGGAPP